MGQRDEEMHNQVSESPEENKQEAKPYDIAHVNILQNPNMETPYVPIVSAPWEKLATTLKHTHTHARTHARTHAHAL